MSENNPPDQDGKPAGLLRRLAAILYDCLLIIALMFLVTLPFIAARDGEPVEVGENLIYQLCLVVLIYVYFVAYWVFKGRTLGMQSWGLRVALPDGQLPGYKSATLRFVTALVSWLPAGLGFLWQLWDKETMTWHDRLSGSRLTYYPKTKEKRKDS
jgi:uncharacterized RDD family membrane protein YckC